MKRFCGVEKMFFVTLRKKKGSFKKHLLTGSLGNQKSFLCGIIIFKSVSEVLLLVTLTLEYTVLAWILPKISVLSRVSTARVLD